MRLPRVTPVVLAVAAVCGAALIFLMLALQPGRTEAFPDLAELEAVLPELSGETRARPWDSGPTALLSFVDGVVEVRTSYAPADGSARRRRLGEGEWTPLPPDADLPDLVVTASPDEHWASFYAAAYDEMNAARFGSIWLAGRDGSGRLAAVPLVVSRLPGFPEHLRRTGIARLSMGYQLDIRIRREGELVLFQWNPAGIRGVPGLSGRFLVEREALRRGDPHVLAPLAASLRRLPAVIPESRIRNVRLVTGPEVRFVDVLRVVECAEGPGEVLFFQGPWWDRTGRDPFELTPVPDDIAVDWSSHIRASKADAAHVTVNVTRNESCVIRGEEYTPEKLREHLLSRGDGARIRLRVDVQVPWGVSREIIRLAYEKPLGLVTLSFAGAPTDPEDRELLLPRIDTGRCAAPVTEFRVDEITSRFPPAEKLAGRAVRLDADDGTPTGDVLTAILRLRAAGAQVAIVTERPGLFSLRPPK